MKLKILLLLLFAFKTLGQSKIDSILLKVDQLSFEKEQNLWQNSQAVQEFFAKFKKDFDDSIRVAKVRETHLDKYEMELFASRNAQNTYLKKLENINEDERAYLTKSIYFNYWLGVINHAVQRSNENTKLLKLISLPEVALEGFDETIVKTNNLSNAVFRKFLPIYIIYFNSKDRNFVKYTDGSTSAVDKFAFAEKHLEAQNFEYYLATLINENCNMIRPSVLKSLMSNLTTNVRDNLTIKCADALNKVEEAIVAKPTDDWGLMGLDGKKVNLADMKGKIVYVDFWASWCGPCRKEFPFSKEMFAKLTDKQKKKIEFLFISIDDNQDLWKAALDKLKLEGKQAWVDKAWGAGVLQRFGVNSIPRYMILDKQGKVIEKKATRPSDPATLPHLLQLSE